MCLSLSGNYSLFSFPQYKHYSISCWLFTCIFFILTLYLYVSSKIKRYNFECFLTIKICLFPQHNVLEIFVTEPNCSPKWWNHSYNYIILYAFKCFSCFFNTIHIKWERIGSQNLQIMDPLSLLSFLTWFNLLGKKDGKKITRERYHSNWLLHFLSIWSWCSSELVSVLKHNKIKQW